jgi:rubrerythrin
MHHNRIDQYEQDWEYYECRSCGARRIEEGHPGVCPACGGDVQNIAVSRE